MYKTLQGLVVTLFLAGFGSHAQTVPVTGVEGESWLNHLHRSFNETSMCKTGRLGPAAPAPGDAVAPAHLELPPNAVPRVITLRGSDLYRLNCQGCHGESGLGAPPEINSLINPVRATSVTAVMERMKKSGMDISQPEAAELAKQSKAALLQRLHNGGEDMPGFPYLSEAEIGSLIAYLKQLAGLSGAAASQAAVRDSPLRVGEFIVKSTCHTCHSAAGLNPDPQKLLDGAIPPLSTLTRRKSEPEFVRKVTAGAPVIMGTPAMSYRGRMPVFGYLSEEEAVDVYLYLKQYPPREVVTLAVMSASAASLGDSDSPFSTSATPGNNNTSDAASRRPNAARMSLVGFAVFPAVLFCFLGTLLVKGLPLAMAFHQDVSATSDTFATTPSPAPAEACAGCSPRSHPSPYLPITVPARAVGERHGES